MMETSTDVLGLMSGTSLDGLDLVCVRFWNEAGSLSHQLLASETIPYDADRRHVLQNAHLLSGEELSKLHVDLGKYFGTAIRSFCDRTNMSPAYVGSHGHTVFHQPENGLTLQIGDPFHMAVQSGVSIVSQFRSMDVAMGGQGAPLVPIADALLYSQYDACLNLGGIANVSYNTPDNQRFASDICICNMALNMLAQRAGKEYDANGAIAAAGRIDSDLLSLLTNDPFYTMAGPKSLGKEFFESNVSPHLKATFDRMSLEDILCTTVEYMAKVIGATLNSIGSRHCLVTGGGAYNDYLIQRTQVHTSCPLIIGDKKEVEFKEAIAFALLAYLRMEGKNNVLRSVTGARCDHSAGILCVPPLG
jgi:anhydro-N-acetylmuramic acid kinase